MLLRPALRPPPSCNIHALGLTFSQTSTRTFTSSPASLISRRLPHQSPRAHGNTHTRTAAIPLSRHPLLLTTIGATALSIPFLTSSTTYNDVSPAPSDFSTSAYSHGKDAKVPISKDGGRSLNPAAIKQISFGSLVGLGLGVLVSAFSRMLVLVVGVGVVVAQYAARKGYNIVPVERLQRHVRGINLRSAINDNAAFKISFGLMFALTAFGDF